MEFGDLWTERESEGQKNDQMSVKVNAEQQFHGTKYEMFALILLKIDSIFSTCHTLQTDSHRHMLPQGFPSKAPTKSRYIKISIKYLEDRSDKWLLIDVIGV